MSEDFYRHPPDNWAVVRISDIAEFNPKLDKSGIPDELEVSFVPMPAVEVGTGRIDASAIRRFSQVKKGYTPFREGDVLFAKITPCMENGKMAIVPAVRNGIGFGSTEFHVLRAKGGIVAEYLYHFVSSKRFRVDAEHNMTGAVGQRRVPTVYLSEHLIPIPPTNEQRRIVARIEELFSELEKGIESLKTAREQLKVYRQAVLKHAFEGKLTAQWRKENQDKLESPEQLLGRIQRERETRYQQQLGEWNKAMEVWKAGGEEGAKPAKPRKPELLIDINKKSLPELPEGWTWEYVGNLNADVFDGPFGSNLRTSDYVEDGIRVIRLENIGYLEFIENKQSYITPEKYESIKKHTVHPGDIIFSSFITDGIRVIVLPENIEYAVNKADCFCLRLHGSLMRNDFTANFLSTRIAYKQIEPEIHGIGRPRINTSQLKYFALPICNREEQSEIMAILSERLSLIYNIDAIIDTELEKCETLRQSILKKAFSGQLVPQDPNDEPASVLLERIRAEKARAQPAGRSRKQRVIA